MFQLSPLVISPEILVAKGGTMWARNGWWILHEMTEFHIAFRNLLHAVNLQHGTDGFTSPPKEGVLRIFSPWKIRQLRPGLNPWTWVPKASMLPLDHRSHLLNNYNNEKKHLSLDKFCFWITTVPSSPMALHTENPKPLLPSSFSCQWIIHQKLGKHSSSASWVTYFNTWRKNATWKSK